MAERPAQILAYEGKVDGLRFGRISFEGSCRHFFLNRLSGELRLYRVRSDGSPEEMPDTNPARLETARELLRRHEP